MTELLLELTVCPEPSCGTVAEINDRFTYASTDGPLAHVKTYCANRHAFILPVGHRLLVCEADPRDAAPPRTDRMGAPERG
jgi:hypothetical protein